MREYRASELIDHNENVSIRKNRVNGVEQEHLHDFIEIVYILSGEGTHMVNGASYGVGRGDLLFINFHQAHAFRSAGEMAYVNLLLLPEFLSKELIDSENAMDMLALSLFEDFGGHMEPAAPKISFRGAELYEVEQLIDNMLREFDEKRLGYRSVLKGLVTVLLAFIFRQMRQADAAGLIRHMDKITPEILQYIEDNCCEKITLGELAAKCFYNPSYFSRIFKECCGKSLTDFIHEKRVLEAVRLLKESAMSVEEICDRVGYREKKQFYKIFRQYTGATPNALRQAAAQIKHVKRDYFLIESAPCHPKSAVLE